YAAVKGEWRYLGRSPMDGVRIPKGYFRWKYTLQGFAPVEAAGSEPSTKTILDKEGAAPPGMARVPVGEFRALLAGIGVLGPVELGDYWIDRYEVTNRQFKEFVDRGGYQKRENWKYQFVKEARVLTWEQGMAEFHDSTGRPGPSTWEAGGYPAGQEDFPVAGVSWYEAAAYAEFAGKSLPTIYHWYRAAAVPAAPYIVPLSNFGGSGPARVGTYEGIGPYGTYDMAGNVKEWSWNEEAGRRYILGGGWNEPAYLFSWAEPRLPFDRSRLNGFRCVKYAGSGGAPEALARPITRVFRDFTKEKPVSADVFQVYKSMYSYDRTDLNPVIESEDNSSEFWRKQKVSFNAAYGSERVIAYLFLPKNKPGPHQTVIFFPGAGAVGARSSEDLPYEKALDFLMKSGRALLFPIYKGTFERSFDRWSGDPAAIRDRAIQWRKDLGRSIDYLQSRNDIDSQKLAYCGHSMGSRTGVILLPLEDRLKVAVLLDGGFSLGRMAGDMPRPLPGPGKPPPEMVRGLPEADPVNFAPRVKIPVLMINGRYDFIFPVEAAQIPLFRALGTPTKDKRHVIFETPHNVFTAGSDMVREVLDWLDRYLGPVNRAASAE
ncbi:MAG: SUMF1/EgtB/PvdO family nonheme iron enzyme, partial [Acidobacteria bacterium]|nr:SUMF1/EgtB/PvdO family nonheme iron enzyme [Acidobacteriota bacterium]